MLFWVCLPKPVARHTLTPLARISCTVSSAPGTGRTAPSAIIASYASAKARFAARAAPASSAKTPAKSSERSSPALRRDRARAASRRAPETPHELRACATARSAAPPSTTVVPFMSSTASRGSGRPAVGGYRVTIVLDPLVAPRGRGHPRIAARAVVPLNGPRTPGEQAPAAAVACRPLRVGPVLTAGAGLV